MGPSPCASRPFALPGRLHRLQHAAEPGRTPARERAHRGVTQGDPGLLLPWEGRDQDGAGRLHTQARPVQGSQSTKLPFN